MIALIDCNSFYASCEEVFNPKLSGLPLLILSNNDGCVIACSKKGKQMGVKIGEPAFQYREHARRGLLRMLSSNFTLYADLSNRVMRILEDFDPDLEIYSIDEAFVQMEPDLGQAAALRHKIKKWTGIPVSIGIAPTKTLAKLANHVAKKDSSSVVALATPAAIRARLAITAPDEIWGIGRASAELLRRKRIYTAAEFVDADDQTIRSALGLHGLKTALELRGTICFEDAGPEKRQSIICSRSFGHRVSDLPSLQEAVAAFATRAAEKLREQESLARFLSLSLVTDAFESYSCHADLLNATSFTPDFIRLAKEGVAKLYRSGVSYRKAGVLLGHFCDEGARQLDLLAPASDNPKLAALMRTLDEINDRYEKGAIRFAAEGLSEQWRSINANASPRFTTSWNDLLKIPD